MTVVNRNKHFPHPSCILAWSFTSAIGTPSDTAAEGKFSMEFMLGQYILMKDIHRCGNTMTGISMTVEGNHLGKPEDTEFVHRNLHKTQQEEFVQSPS